MVPGPARTSRRGEPGGQGERARRAGNGEWVMGNGKCGEWVMGNGGYIPFLPCFPFVLLGALRPVNGVNQVRPCASA